MEETEKIVVEVDGAGASRAFDRIADSAANADEMINRVGEAAKKLDYTLGGASSLTTWGKQIQAHIVQPAPQAVSSLDSMGSAFEKLMTKVSKTQSTLDSFFSAGKWGEMYDFFANVFQRALGFADEYIKKLTVVQRTMSLLATIPGSNAQDEFEYIINAANKYGVSLQAVQDNYVQLQLAAQGTNLTTDQVRKVFEQTATAARVLHMSTVQTNLTFMGLVQMLSKGTVSMEEFRKQMSQRLPGMIPAVAAELGTTTAELEKFIAAGSAASDKMLPYLGNALERIYGPGILNAANALDAQMNRVTNSVEVFFKAVYDAGGSNGPTAVLKALNEQLSNPELASKFANMVNTISESVANFIRSVTKEDVTKAGETLLEFLNAVAKLSMFAANSLMFLAKHLGVVGAVIGAYYGAQAGFLVGGPIGAAVGAGVGALGGAYAANSMVGNQGNVRSAETFQNELAAIDAKIAKQQSLLDNMGPKGSRNYVPGVAMNAERFIQQYQKEKDKLTKDYAPVLDALLEAQAPSTYESGLPDLPAAGSGDLKKLLGKPGKTSKELSLEKRQTEFLDRLASQYNAMMNPETDKYDAIYSGMRKLGLGKSSMVPGLKDSSGKPMTLEQAVQGMQDYANAKKALAEQEKIDKEANAYEEKIFSVNRSFGKANRSWDKQVMESNVSLDTMFMPQINKDTAKKMDELMLMYKNKVQDLHDEIARKGLTDDIFKLDFDQLEADFKRASDIIISNMKRVHEESRSVQAGEKMFLLSYKDNATNYAKMTQGFLQGSFTQIEDMLYELVRHGKLSFAKLGEFILDYMLKLSIAKAMTPMVDGITSVLTSIFSAAIGAPDVGASSAAVSQYSLASGNSGLGLRFRASGGLMYPGQDYMVGENGPERARVSQLTRIDPAGGDGGTPVYVYVQDSGVSTSNDKDGLGKKLGDAVRNVLIDEKRPGGLLASA